MYWNAHKLLVEHSELHKGWKDSSYWLKVHDRRLWSWIENQCQSLSIVFVGAIVKRGCKDNINGLALVLQFDRLQISFKHNHRVIVTVHIEFTGRACNYYIACAYTCFGTWVSWCLPKCWQSISLKCMLPTFLTTIPEYKYQSINWQKHIGLSYWAMHYWLRPFAACTGY